MTGRLLILLMLVSALAVGGGIWYAQVYAFYSEPSLEEAGGVVLTDAATGEVREIPVEFFQAIDSDSSPIRFRACFDLGERVDDLDWAAPYEGAQPLVAPGWFDCFDAGSLDAALTDGGATPYLGVKDIQYGIDRIVAVAPDGKGWMWHQINRCGAAVFDGNPAPDGCPPPPEGTARQDAAPD